jgi:cytochrome c biogenesis protein ResB
MTIVFSLLVSIIGLIMYIMAEKPKIVEIGRIMFWTGLLAFLLGGGLAGVIHLIPSGKT